MAGTINWDSIMKKAKAHVESKEQRNRVSRIMDDYMTGKTPMPRDMKNVHSAEEAGFKFADVLIREIESSPIPERLAEKLASSVHVTPVTKVGDGRYFVRVYFEDVLGESMSTHKEYYTVDLAELYNSGVDHVMAQIFETVNKKLRVSDTIIPGAHFMEQAIIDFEGNYASDYNVIDITILGDDVDSIRGTSYRKYYGQNEFIRNGD